MLGRVSVTLLILILPGCAQTQLGETSLPQPEHQARLPASTLHPQVAILVSEDLPAYTEVANTLVKLLGRRGSIYYLTGSQLDNLKIVNKLNSGQHMQIVSVGLSAAVAAKALSNKQIIFCQVYNYQDYALLSAKHKGVSMLPSLPKMFSAWRALAPDTRDIGVLSGPGLDDVIHAAQAAARASGFTLHFETVNSDKEYQYTFKKLSKKVQGFWLLPDNRVLSEHVLRDVMTFSVRNSKQVVVFSDELLKLGGLLSIRSDPADIAQQVFERLEQAQLKEDVPGPDIVYLDKLNLRINSVMANNLNLKIPVSYKKYAHAL